MKQDKLIWGLIAADIVRVAERKKIENPKQFVKNNWKEIQSGIEFGLEFWEEVVSSALEL